MAAQARIEPADREFFELVAQTAFCNPFSEQRAELDSKIIRRAVEPFSEAHLDELTRVISARVQKLEARGLADVRQYSVRDRDLMQTLFLFELFHQCFRELDQLITEQAKVGTESAPVKFGGEVLGRMRRRGLGAAESARVFSIFYQLRRAFHFIVRGLIGNSPCMRQFRRHLWQNVFTKEVRLYERYLWDRMEDFSTLLLGETGTGNGTAAAAIGRSGYIPFNEKQGRFRWRVIAATNRPLETLREGKLFRDDFFYRLCSDVIEVPPLRQRLQEDPKELRQLLEHVLTGMLGGPGPELVAQV